MTLPSATNEWNLRTEIFEIAHRWPQVFIAFLLGSLMGWGAGFIFPTSHRAQSELYVAYNGDAIYRNPDDYKNWQFSELDAYIVSNDVLSETLKQLGEQDAFWQGISNAQLQPHLHTYWRNAGRWRLVADWREQVHAKQLAQTWTAVVLEKTNQAAVHAATVLALDAQIGAVSREEVNLKLRVTQLSQMGSTLQTWRDTHNSQGSTPLDTLSRWRLQFLGSSMAGMVPGEFALLEQFPPLEAATEAYLPAVEQAIVALDGQLAVEQPQLADLTAQREELEKKREEESKASHNLTANLQVEPFSDKVSPAVPVRATSQMAIVGGALGVIVWGLVWLGRPLRKAGR